MNKINKTLAGLLVGLAAYTINIGVRASNALEYSRELKKEIEFLDKIQDKYEWAIETRGTYKNHQAFRATINQIDPEFNRDLDKIIQSYEETKSLERSLHSKIENELRKAFFVF